jgi:hypothetical protein
MSNNKYDVFKNSINEMWLELKKNTIIDDDIKNLCNIYKNISISNDYQYNLDNLPSEITTLYIEEDRQLQAFNNIIDFDKNFNKSLDNLPYGLKKLWVCTPNFNQPLDYLPNSLEELVIYSNYFNQSLDNLPIGLKKLEITIGIFDKQLLNLPIRLEKVILPKKYQFIKEIKEKYPKIEISVSERDYY